MLATITATILATWMFTIAPTSDPNRPFTTVRLQGVTETACLEVRNKVAQDFEPRFFVSSCKRDVTPGQGLIERL